MADESYRMNAAWTRRLKLLPLLLQRASVSTAEVARTLDVDRRTALKDLGALASHGVPLYEEGDGQERRWVLAPTFRRLGYVVSFEDRLALLFGGELVQGFLRETDLGEALSALTRTVGALDKEVRLTDEELARRFFVLHEPGKDYARHRETLAALTPAILGALRVSFEYTSGRTSEHTAYRSVAPLSLLLYKRGVYLAFQRHEERRIVAIERMADLVVHGDLPFDYPRPAEYHPRALLAGRFGITTGDAPPSEVVLRFAPQVTTYVASRRWMAGDHIERHDDGGCTLTFIATGSELIPFVLGYGNKVKVLEPAWLRDAVVRELRGALDQYGPV